MYMALKKAKIKSEYEGQTYELQDLSEEALIDRFEMEEYNGAQI